MAESRGTPAKYCSTRCRETANKRAVRQRARERTQADVDAACAGLAQYEFSHGPLATTEGAIKAIADATQEPDPDEEADDDAAPSPIDEFLDELDDLAVRRARRAP